MQCEFFSKRVSIQSAYHFYKIKKMNSLAVVTFSLLNVTAVDVCVSILFMTNLHSHKLSHFYYIYKKLCRTNVKMKLGSNFMAGNSL